MPGATNPDPSGTDEAEAAAGQGRWSRRTIGKVVSASVVVALAIGTAILLATGGAPHAVAPDLTGAKVAVVGDSLIKLSTDELLVALPEAGYVPTIVEGINGITTDKRADDLAAAIAPPDGAQILVVGLGTNDVHAAYLMGANDFRARPLGDSLDDVDRVLSNLTAEGSTLECLIWVNVKTTTANDGLDTIGPEYNDHLAMWADRANEAGVPVRIADWASFSVGHDDWFIPDEIHFTQDGQDAYTRLILVTIDTCDQ